MKQFNGLICSYRSARDSKPLEVLGTYNPVPQKPTNLTDEEARIAKAYKEFALDRSRAKYWLGVGAQPSEPVWRLLSMVRERALGWSTALITAAFSFLPLSSLS